MKREQLLAIKSAKVEKVKVSGIGDLHVRVLSARAALELDGKLKQADGTVSMVAFQLSSFLCDESGSALLSEEDAAQLLDKLSAKQVREIIQHGVRLNALGEESVEAAGGN